MHFALLDTEIFIHENLRFDSRRLQELVSLVSAGQVNILLTDIIVSEVDRAIATRVKDALSLLKQPATKRLLGSLAQSTNPSLSVLGARHNEHEITVELRSAFRKLLNDLQAEIIPTDAVNVAELRRRYFGSVSPFGARDAKKHEFPDAITFLAVQSWAEDHGRSVHMVSHDQGLLSAAEASDSVRPLKSLAELLDLLIKTRDQRARAAQAAVDELRDEIDGAILQRFLAASFFVEDYYGDVSDVEVQSLEVTQINIVDLNDYMAEYDIAAIVEFSAHISYDDPDQSYYDHEEGRLMVLGQIETAAFDTAEVSARLVIALDFAKPANSTIESLDLTDNEVFISVYPDSPDRHRVRRR